MATDMTVAALDMNTILAPNSYAMRVIRYRAAWLVQRNGAARDAQEDLEQELCLRLLKRLRNYDPARSRLNTYIANSIRYEAHSILRQRLGDKHLQNCAAKSLDAELRQPCGQRQVLGDSVTRSQQVRGRGRAKDDDLDQWELREDVQAVMASLPQNLQAACQAMLEASSSSAARRAVSPADRETIRRHFANAGLNLDV